MDSIIGQDMFSSSRRTGMTAILFSFKGIPPIIQKTGIGVRVSAPRYPFFPAAWQPAGGQNVCI